MGAGTVTATPPTPQAVSRVLSQAGHQKGEDAPKRSVRGGRAGFHVWSVAGDVMVNHWAMTMGPSRRIELEKLAAYAETLDAAGYVTGRKED